MANVSERPLLLEKKRTVCEVTTCNISSLMKISHVNVHAINYWGWQCVFVRTAGMTLDCQRWDWAMGRTRYNSLTWRHIIGTINTECDHTLDNVMHCRHFSQWIFRACSARHLSQCRTFYPYDLGSMPKSEACFIRNKSNFLRRFMWHIIYTRVGWA
jgi:hypothetical protein